MAQRTGLILSGIAPILSTIGLGLSQKQSGWFPAEYFLTRPCVVIDQGDVLPCCVSCAIATCVEIFDRSCDQLSPLFHFYKANADLHGGPPESFEGMELQDGLNMLIRHGICLHRYHPASFTEEGARTTPGPRAIEDALVRRKPFAFDYNRESVGFKELTDDNRVAEWKKVLLGNRPILAGMRTTDDYRRKLLARRNMMERLEGTLEPHAPHAVVVLGYRESEGSFLVQDSRGEHFTTPVLQGRWWLPYKRILYDDNVVESAYAVGPVVS